MKAAALSEVGGPERAASVLGLRLTGIFAASAVAPWLFGFAADRPSLSWAWAGGYGSCEDAAGVLVFKIGVGAFVGIGGLIRCLRLNCDTQNAHP